MAENETLGNIVNVKCFWKFIHGAGGFSCPEQGLFSLPVTYSFMSCIVFKFYLL